MNLKFATKLAAIGVIMIIARLIYDILNLFEVVKFTEKRCLLLELIHITFYQIGRKSLKPGNTVDRQQLEFSPRLLPMF